MSRVVMLVGEEFEDSEVAVPLERLKSAGHEVVVMGRDRGAVLVGKRGERSVEIGVTAESAYPDDYDALVIPGGHSPDHLRLAGDIVSFVHGFMATDKPVAAICHGPQLLIEAETVNGRTLTSWPSVRKDLLNAGAHWVDEPVVEDGNLITSREPGDLDVFCDALLTRLREEEPV
jgi:protease I